MTSILLWFIIGSKGKWIIKTLVTLVCLFYSVLVWLSLHTYLGWPSKEQLPDNYVVYWAQVQEPDPNCEGAIFVWLCELDSKNYSYEILGYDNKIGEPRVHQIDYSKSLHKNIQNMIEDIKKGSVYIGVKKDKEKPQSFELNPLGQIGQFNFSQNSNDHYMFPLPPANILEKVRQ